MGFRRAEYWETRLSEPVCWETARYPLSALRARCERFTILPTHHMVWEPPLVPKAEPQGGAQGDPRAPQLLSNDIAVAEGVAAGGTDMTQLKIYETWA